MSEKSVSEEVEAIVSATTFADLARALEPLSQRWPWRSSYARAEQAFERVPKIVRKRFAKLKVFDAAALVREIARPKQG
jgi:hypothetical protein